MKIGKPIKDFKNAPYPQGSITQYFGENHDLYFSRMGMQGHNGIDIVAPHGTPLLCVEGGRVNTLKDTAEGYGKHIRIISADGKREWVYGHCDVISVYVGQWLQTGDVIGTMGNTGFVVSSQNAGGFWKYNPYLGTHLHLGVRDLNGTTVLNYDNGYFGSYDFKDMLPDLDPVNDDIVSFVNLLRTLLMKLQQAGIQLNWK